MPRYRYTHSVPSAFIQLVKDGKTWTPELGDEIETDAPVDHPHLKLIADVQEETEAPGKTIEAKESATNGDNLKES